MKYVIICIVVPLLLTGCSKEQADDEPSVVDVESTDTLMNAAIERARRTVDIFIENYRTMENDGYSMKFGLITADGGVEHIWFNPIEINGDEIKAECANEPRNITGLKVGDVRTFKKSQVTDWMIVVGNKCYGGFTIQVIAAKDPSNMPLYEFVEFE